jgi:hypothetical protein
MSNTGIKVEGATGSKSKEGVIQWVIPYYVPDVSQVQTVGKTPYENCTEVSRSWTCNHDGSTPSYIVTVTYEGGSSESDNSATYGDTDSQVWSLDFELAEEPIEAHWNFDEIKKQYGGKWEDHENQQGWVFPKELPEGSSAKSGLSSSKNGGKPQSPMFGVKTYIVMNCTASVSYTKKTLPAAVIGAIGYSYQKIPGAPQQFNDLDTADRNWMKMPPQISKRGSVWQISESWRLSEYYKWPKEVYPNGIK